MFDLTDVGGQPPGVGEGSDVDVAVMRRGDQLLVSLRGEADAFSAAGLRDGLATAFQPPPGSVVVDFAGLTFCDVSGMRAIRGFVDRAADAGVHVELRRMSALTGRLFEMLGAETFG